MHWNWQQKDWPNFRFDGTVLAAREARFLHGTGLFIGAFSHLEETDKHQLAIEIISDELHRTCKHQHLQ